MQKTPMPRTNPQHRGFCLLARDLVPLGSVCAFRRAGSHPLTCHTALRHVVPCSGDYIDCGQLPRSRLTLSELSSELLSKSVRFESDVGAVSRPLCC